MVNNKKKMGKQSEKKQLATIEVPPQHHGTELQKLATIGYHHTNWVLTLIMINFISHYPNLSQSFRLVTSGS